MKLISAGIGASLAGCMGSDDSGSDSSTDSSSGSGEFSDVTMNHWDIIGAQGQVVREAVDELVSKFETETGASVETNFSGPPQLYGDEWINQFNRGEYPVMVDTDQVAMGKFYKEDYMVPFSEYQDQLDDDIVENIQWIMPMVEESNRFWDNGPFDIPYGVNARTPIVIRTDHFEEAGLSVEEDFPPESYEELYELATTLQEDGPTDVGYPVYGTGFDWNDTLDPWRVAAGPEAEARYLNEDGTDVMYPSDHWVEWTQKMVDFHEDGLATDRSPSLTDETARDLLIQGEISMAQIEFFNIPTLYERAEDMLRDGTLRFGPAWGGETGDRSLQLHYSVGITNPPQGADQASWERKQEAGIEFMNYFFSKDFQRKLPKALGLWPVRKDVWDEIGEEELPGEENHKIGETHRLMAENGKAMPTMENAAALSFQIPAAQIQQALQGNKSVQQAFEDARSEAQDLVR